MPVQTRARAPVEAFRIPPPKRRMRRQLQPDAMRMFYFSALRAMLAKAHDLVQRTVWPEVLKLLPEGARTDASDEERARKAVREAARKFMRTNTATAKVEDLAGEVAKRTSDFQRDQLFKQIKDAVGVDPFIADGFLADASAKFVAENVSLIQSVPAGYFDRIEETVATGVRDGERASTIAKTLEDDYGASESHAQLIANDQVGKFYGDLNEERQTDLGITRYTWVTVHDNRVRTSHADLDGKTFEWGDPPTDSQTGEKVTPGSAIQCRCQASPDLSDAFL